jgi:NAD(P)-dependent dehydrogenase (short-subunit alcohol dehydrogenase family)
MPPTVVLITGANRGIGKGLLELYLLKPNHLVIAANRDPEHPTSKALAELPTADGTRLLVVKIDATVRTAGSIFIFSDHNAHESVSIPLVLEFKVTMILNAGRDNGAT